jgi:mono/diheme cytochrome c family protein
MSRTVGAAALILSAALFASAGGTAAPFDLKSTTVDLPDGDRTFPPGPGADALNNNCLACHSAGMVLNQPAFPRVAWAAEVNKMITVYRAPVAAKDVDAIVDYLAALRSGK